jgi:hypothetical protein
LKITSVNKDEIWKINWDAAISKELEKMGVGLLIQDVDGRVVAARTVEGCLLYH